MTDKLFPRELSAPLSLILEKELDAGNIITETYLGRFTGVTEELFFVFLKYPFKTEIKELEGLIYCEINDRHYWKAEYRDVHAHQILACGFGE